MPGRIAETPVVASERTAVMQEAAPEHTAVTSVAVVPEHTAVTQVAVVPVHIAAMSAAAVQQVLPVRALQSDNAEARLPVLFLFQQARCRPGGQQYFPRQDSLVVLRTQECSLQYEQLIPELQALAAWLVLLAETIVKD